MCSDFVLITHVQRSNESIKTKKQDENDERKRRIKPKKQKEEG